MSKKHFIALADFIKSTPALNNPDVIDGLTAFCAEQNPNFNATRFINYIAGLCGPNGGSK